MSKFDLMANNDIDIRVTTSRGGFREILQEAVKNNAGASVFATINNVSNYHVTYGVYNVTTFELPSGILITTLWLQLSVDSYCVGALLDEIDEKSPRGPIVMVLREEKAAKQHWDGSHAYKLAGCTFDNVEVNPELGIVIHGNMKYKFTGIKTFAKQLGLQ